MTNKSPHIIKYGDMEFDLRDRDHLIKLAKMGYFTQKQEFFETRETPDFYDSDLYRGK